MLNQRTNSASVFCLGLPPNTGLRRIKYQVFGHAAPWRNLMRAILFGGLLLVGYLPTMAQESFSADLSVALQLEEAVTSAIARAERSVVALARVRKPAADAEFFQGLQLSRELDPTDPNFIPNDFAAGVVVDADGLILTNYHVLRDVEDSNYYITTVAQETYEAKVFAADPRSDLAVLKIDGSGLSAIELGDAESLRKGQFVISLGNPYAVARDGQASASFGIVANLARKASPGIFSQIDPLTNSPVPKPTLHHFGTLIQTDAKLNLGTSGGILVDLRGKMVGLTTAIAAIAGYETAAGYAIPVDETFRRVLGQLKEGREVEYGFLGVAPSSLSNIERDRGISGVRIDYVFPGTPADQAGLQTDDVVTHVDERPVSEADEFFLAVGRLPPFTQIQLTVARARSGKAEDLTVVLGKYRVPARQIVSTPQPAWRGVQVDAPSATMVLRAGDRVPQGCVVVTNVVLDSPAWKAGLRPGTLIAKINGEVADSPRTFYDLTAAATGDVEIELYHDGGKLVITENESSN